MTRRALLISAPFALTALLLAGCGSAAENGTDGDTLPPRDDDIDSVTFTFGLPPSDTSVSGNDGPAYAALQQGCDQGQAYLDLVRPEGYGFRSPRNVVVFAAAIAVCRGDLDTALVLVTHAESVYGLAGLSNPSHVPSSPECELYRSVRSVLDQQPREAYECPGGEPPENRITVTDDGDFFVDDPLTFDVDESIPPTTPETTDPAEPDPTDPPATDDGDDSS